MYDNRRPDVAVFIDFENVYVSVRDKLNANPNFEAIMDRCSDLGRVVIARAYADWYRYPRVTSALYANAIEPIYVATYYYDKDVGRTGRAIKNSVDMNLCIDAMKTLFTNTNISRFVLVTGDRDFIPLVNSIRQQGKEVYIIGIGGAASTHLAQSADEFVFYEQLVGRQHGGSAAANAIASRATELVRNAEAVEPPPPVAPPPPAPVAAAAPAAPAPAETDVYDVLIEAIHLVRKRGYVSTLGSIKLVMKELMGGDFKESRYKDLSGRPFAKFKDFVMDAEKRGKVQIFTNGTVNEVFLPGEDPYKLSQFAAALSEEAPVVEPVADVVVQANGRKEPPPAKAEERAEAGPPAAGRRRRRRSRRGQGGASAVDAQIEAAEIELEEPDYTPPFDDTPPAVAPAGDDELRALEALEEPAELAALAEEQLPEELAAAQEPLAEPPVLIEDAPLSPEELVAGDEPHAHAPVVIEDTPLSPEELVEGDEAHAHAPVIVDTPITPEELVEAPAPAPAAEEAPAAAEEDEEEEAGEPLEFSPEEWAIFREMMRGFTKPASFQQIFDALRALRKEQNLTRTNEQLRTLAKQAINSGMLERSGRGKRVYYSLKAEE